MGFFLKTRQLDLETGQSSVVLLNEPEALNDGIRPGDKVLLRWGKNKEAVVTADTSNTLISAGEIGLFEEVWKKKGIPADEIVEISLVGRPRSIEAIRKRLLGKPLSYEEIRSIMEDVAEGRIGTIEMAYFVASSYFKEHSIQEIYYMTKAMAETGDTLHLPGHLIVDKHSVGGVPGNRTTMIVIPIVASYGLTIPKTSSRAITSPAGTADTMEVLAPVEFSMDKILSIVNEHHGCLIWGGGLRLAPADDLFIKVTYPLSLEPYDKMIVSILAKKVAMGVKVLVLDIPFGPTTKIPDRETAKLLEKKFIQVGKRFGIKIKVVMIPAKEPIGEGVGPAIEARDVMRVLEHTPHRPRDLEKKSVILAGTLLELAGVAKRGEGREMAHQALKNGAALKKMHDIIRAQGGKVRKADDLTKGAVTHRLFADRGGKLVDVNNKLINEIARTLGAPFEKLAGMSIYKKVGQRIVKGEHVATLYARTSGRLELAVKALNHLQIFKIR